MLAGRRTAIGVDIGSRRIKATQLVRSGQQYQIAAVSLLARTRPSEPISREDLDDLKRVLVQQGFQGRKLIVAAPQNKLLHGIFDLPANLQEEAIEQVTRMELARMHQLSPDAFEMAHWKSAPQEPKTLVQTVAIGCAHDAVNAFIDMFEESGFSVCAVDVNSAAAMRACLPLMAPSPATTCILDLGWSSTSMLFVREGALVYERSLTGRCMAELVEPLAMRFHISAAAAADLCRMVGLVDGGDTGPLDHESAKAVREIISGHFQHLLEELETPVAYVRRRHQGHGVERVLLIGGGAEIPGLAAYSREVLGLETLVGMPAELATKSSQVLRRALTPAMTVAVGLAKFEGA